MQASTDRSIATDIFSTAERGEQKVYDIRRDLVYALDPARYVESLRFRSFPWQQAVLSSTAKRIAIDGARQSGKSTIISALPCHHAKYYPKSLSIILAPTEDQSKEDMIKVKEFISMDSSYPEVKRYASDQVELRNGSRILIIIATDKAARGYSAPDLIVIDEASRVPDIVYSSGVRAMLTDNRQARLIVISTPFGQQGFFWKAMTQGKSWERYYIRSPFSVDTEDSYSLHEYPGGEAAFQAEQAAKGIKAWFSPRHSSLQEQQEQLEEIGKQQYEQEMCGMFVEAEGMVFGYDEINAAFSSACTPLTAGSEADISSAPPPPWMKEA